MSELLIDIAEAAGCPDWNCGGAFEREDGLLRCQKCDTAYKPTLRAYRKAKGEERKFFDIHIGLDEVVE